MQPKDKTKGGATKMKSMQKEIHTRYLKNPLYDHRHNNLPYTNMPPKHQHNHFNNFPYTNIPPEYQHNHFNAFAYQNHFQPQNQFPPSNNNIRPNYGNLFQGGY